MRPFLRSVILSSTLVAACAGCGQSPSAPSSAAPSHPLAGMWSGTLTISRAGFPDIVGPAVLVFASDPSSPTNGYSAQVSSSNPWLTFSSSATAVVDAPYAPPAPVYMQGSYANPRGCVSAFASTGSFTTTQLIASFTSADCDSATFNGQLSLTRR